MFQSKDVVDKKKMDVSVRCRGCVLCFTGPSVVNNVVQLVLHIWLILHVWNFISLSWVCVKDSLSAFSVAHSSVLLVGQFWGWGVWSVFMWGSRFHWTGFPDTRLLCYYNTNTAAVSAITQTDLSKAKPLQERIHAQAFKTQCDV